MTIQQAQNYNFVRLIFSAFTSTTPYQWPTKLQYFIDTIYVLAQQININIAITNSMSIPTALAMYQNIKMYRELR
jgi:hypothetical protein